MHYVRIVFAGEDVTRTAHVRRKLVNLIEWAIHRSFAESRIAEVPLDEFIGGRRAEFRMLQIGSANPHSLALQSPDKVGSDESASSANKCRFLHSNLVRSGTTIVAPKGVKAPSMPHSAEWQRSPFRR